MRTLMVLRHARTESSRPGSTDHARRLTANGVRQASELGEHLRSSGVQVDRALCSSATRARQTFEALGLDTPDVIIDELYNAGGEEILKVLREQDDELLTVLVVGHAPGLPSLAYELADPATSDADALAAIEWRFPAGTLATLHVPGPWSTLQWPVGSEAGGSRGSPALVSVRLP